METAASNEAIEQGTLQKTIQSTLDELNPEAAYFTVSDGCRTAYVFFDLDDVSRMPKISEPFFMQLHAKIDYTPVMDREDLRQGLAALGR
ncbi:hypothetical protein ACIGO8_12090 [Streptomyces sp. NPDC053493]|uniref:hypothetical protein n=1 Tax=Streptomyces sp. NPDC053493 TaxID=3365705 RepID=UPI0037D1DFE4